jgi:hypothetical protein
MIYLFFRGMRRSATEASTPSTGPLADIAAPLAGESIPTSAPGPLSDYDTAVDRPPLLLSQVLFCGFFVFVYDLLVNSVLM